MTATATAPPLTIASRFIQCLWPDRSAIPNNGRVGLVQFNGGGCVTKFIDPCDCKSIEAFIAHARRQQFCAYFNTAVVHDRLGTNQRGGEKDVLAVSCLKLDCDCPKEGNDTVYPPWQVAYDCLQQMPLAPSLVINSGGGWHAYWLLSRPVVFHTDPQVAADQKRRMKRITSSWEAIYRAKLQTVDATYCCDSTANIDRVMRLPGSLNFRYGEPRPVEVVDGNLDDPVRHDIAEFEIFVPPPEPVESYAQNGSGNYSDSPGTLFNQHGPPWSQLLCPAGWEEVDKVGDLTRWRRPGKSQGISATTGCRSKSGHELFCCFTSAVEAAPFKGGENGQPCSSYSRFAVYALLHHNGDFSAAAKSLADDGYSDRPKRKASSSDAGELPVIRADSGNLRKQTRESWKAIHKANNPAFLFRFGGVPSRVEEDDDGNPITASLDKYRLRHVLARSADWQKQVKDGDDFKLVPAHPPIAVVEDCLATPIHKTKLPILSRIVPAPVFSPRGVLQLDPGYHKDGRTFYRPTPGLSIPTVSKRPSKEEINQAQSLFCQELIVDFPFIGVPEIANAVAAAILPFARDLIDGPTPNHLISKPKTGTGGTLLAEMLSYPFLGGPPSTLVPGRDDDEWRKRITAKLKRSPPIVLIDNLKRKLDSASVAIALTNRSWDDRILKESVDVSLPIRCTWMSTGNNPELSDEITRRTIRIRLNANKDRPWIGREFKHPDIHLWAAEHRGQLIWAALTMIAAWIAKGRPKGAVKLGMYESWSQTIGGILDVAGIPEFLENRTQFYDESDNEGEAWRAFMLAWWETHQETPVLSKELLPLAQECGVQINGKTEHGIAVSFGTMIRHKKDATFDIERPKDKDTTEVMTLRIAKDDEEKRAAKWKLTRMDQQPNG